MRERTDLEETAPGWPSVKRRVVATYGWPTSGTRSRTVRSLLRRTSCAVNRFWRIVEGRGESIDETKPLSIRLE